MGKGKYPFRRTVEFLSGGKVVLKRNVKTVHLLYSPRDSSKGLRNFIFKDVPQLQYKNPDVQFVVSKGSITPARIDIYFEKSDKVKIDVESSRASEIFTMFQHVAGASDSEQKEITSKKPKYPARLNQANFGRFGHCFCICQKPGQAGCPSTTSLPGANKPKWWQVKAEKGSD